MKAVGNYVQGKCMLTGLDIILSLWLQLYILCKRAVFSADWIYWKSEAKKRHLWSVCDIWSPSVHAVGTAHDM